MTLKFQHILSSIHNDSKRSLNISDDNILDFSTNDYLCLAHNPQLIANTQEFINTHGVGATASRLLGGNKSYHIELESQISLSYNKEGTLLFPSGFQCNYAAVSTLFSTQVDDYIIFSDHLNHNSIYHGILASKSRFVRYRHLDYGHLDSLLQKHPNKKKIIISETLFSMDGDVLNLNTLYEVAQKHNAYIYLDEAHAIGVIGNHGYGITEDKTDMADFIIATFGKALGSGGAFITTQQDAIAYMVNKSHGFIYSTAITPMQVGAAMHAFNMLPSMSQQRQALQDLAAYTRTKLHAKGFNTGSSSTHIIPIILEDDATTMQMYSKLLQHKILVSAIRPPTVPQGSSRLRLSLNVGHTKNDINKFIEILCQI